MKKITILVVALLAFSISNSSCKKKPTDDLELIVTNDFSKATATFQFVDAKTGEQIDLDVNKNLSITIAGKDKDKIVDNAGGSNPDAVKGFLGIALKEGLVPLGSNPFNFSVIAHADGYLSTSVNVFMNEEGNQHIIVPMVNLSDTPSGVSAESATISSVPASGVTNSVFTLSPAATPSTGTTAAVTIPAGTKLMDKNGNVVSGNISASLVYFNNMEESAVASFPGGLSGINTSNDEDGINFKTAGFVAMNLTSASGTAVKQFDQAISMTVSIPDGTTDGDGNVISAGTIVPIWSYDPETAEWKLEANPVVVMNAGKLEVTYEMTHLSYWNLDWKNSLRCSLGSQIKFTSCMNQFYNGYVKFSPIGGGGYSYYPYYTKNIMNGSSFSLMNAPSSPTKITVYKNYFEMMNNQNGISKDFNSLCAPSLQTMDLSTWPGFVCPVSLTVQIDATCSGVNRTIRPSCAVYAQKTGTNYWFFVGYMINGNLQTFSLNQGDTYLFKVQIGSQLFTAPNNFTVTEQNYNLNMTLNSNICALLQF
jgi:hypothetical protein